MARLQVGVETTGMARIWVERLGTQVRGVTRSLALVVLAVVSWATTVQAAGSCAALSCGVPIAGTVALAGIDCHTFEGSASEVVSIAIDSATGGTFSPRWTLRAPGGASVGAGNFADQRNLTLPSTGTYTIDVNDNGNDKAGTYTLTYVVVSDAPSSCASAIACGATTAATIATTTESDTYTFAAQSGEVASLTSSETATGLNVCWELYDPAGTSLANSCVQRTVTLPSTGTYTIRVSENGDNDVGPYNLNFTMASATGSSCTAVLACGQTLAPMITPQTDTDTFTFVTSLASESVRIITTGAGGTFNPCWTVFAAPGAAPTSAGTPTPICGQADTILPNAGTHVIRVSDSNDDATGSYGLGLQCLGTATPTVSTTPTLTVAPTETLTPTPTVTPSATSETPTATPTGTPDVTATPTATTSVTPHPNPTATPIGPPAGLADPKAAKAAVRCQKTLLSASANYVTTRMKRLESCSTRMLGCVETRPGDGGCRDKTAASCTRGIGNLSADEARMRAAIGKRCGLVPPTDRGSAAGLGFDAQAGTCPTVGDVNGLVGCAAARGRCSGDGMMAGEQPRTGELLRLVGAKLEPDACLVDYGGAGGDVGDPGTLGGQVLQCARTVTRAGRTLASARLTRTASCVNAIFACVQLHPGEASCLTRAALRCGAEAGKIIAAEAKFIGATNQRCLAVPFATLAAVGGLDLTALNARCAALGVGPVSGLGVYQDCVQRGHACDTATVLAAAAPRAGEMLAQVQRPLFESFCPVP